MAFLEKLWANGAGGGTPITAAELNRIESGIATGPVNYARPLRNALARGVVVDTRSDGVVTSHTSRIRCVLRGGAVMVRLVYVNWYLPSGSSEQPMGNPYDIKASVENPAIDGGRPNGDVTIPVFFGGKRTATVENNGMVISDPVLVNAPADWAVFVRSCATVTSGGRFPASYATNTSGSAQLDTSGVAEGFVTNTDSVDSGTISASSGFTIGPVAVLVEAIGDVQTHGALVIGDSHARGTGIITQRASFLSQACINAGIPIHRLAVGGESFAFAKSPANIYRRMALARFARHALVGMGTNDIWSGYSLEVVQGNAIAFWRLMSDQGLRVHQATILPRPGATTDGYLTASGQSIVNAGYEAVRTGFNTWLRTSAVADAGGALASVIDAATQVEVNAANTPTLNGGFWKAGGPVSVSGTATGVTTTTLTDSSKAWTVNEFMNQVLFIVSATTGQGQLALIKSNTATTLTINPAFSPTPTGTITYQVAPAACWDHVHPTEPCYATITDGLDLSYLTVT